MERTFVIIKPDAVKKKLIGKIISIYEENHLDIVYMYKVLPTKEVLKKHYAALEGKEFYDSVIGFMTSSEVVVLILEGENAVKIVREIHGATNPLKAKPGSIRYMFGENIEENAVHGAESIEEAKKEIEIWKE